MAARFDAIFDIALGRAPLGDYGFGRACGYDLDRYAYPHRMSVWRSRCSSLWFGRCQSTDCAVYAQSADRYEVIELATAHAERHKRVQR